MHKRYDFKGKLRVKVHNSAVFAKGYFKTYAYYDEDNTLHLYRDKWNKFSPIWDSETVLAVWDEETLSWLGKEHMDSFKHNIAS